MAIQILPRSQGFGELLGQNFGQGLGMLAQHKLNQLHETRALDRLKGMGVSDEDAQFISALPPQQQLQALNLLWAQMPQQESLSQIAQSLSGLGSPQESTQTGMGMQQLPKGFQSLPLSEMLSQLGSMGSGMSAMQQQEQMPQEVLQQQQMGQPQPQQQRPSLRSGIQAAQQRAISAATAKERMAEQKVIDKETLPLYDKIVADKDVADMSDKRLNKMEALIKKGDLPPTALYRFLKNLEENVPATSGAAVGGGIGALAAGPLGAAVGAGIGGLISPIASVLRSVQSGIFPDAEQFEKLSTDFVRDAKNIFGSRITDADLQTFLQMIPTLAQTDQGKQAIIKNIKMFNEGAQIKYKNMKKIVHENGGKRPANLAILIEERAKPELDKLSKRFASV